MGLPTWTTIFSPSPSTSTDAVVSILGTAVAEIDAEGYVLDINETGEEYWGLPKGLRVPRSLRRALNNAQNVAEFYQIEAFGLQLQAIPLKQGGWLLTSAPTTETQNDTSPPHEPVVTPTPEALTGPNMDKAAVLLLRMKQDCTVLYANTDTKILTGYTAESIINRRFLLEILHPEDRWKLTKAIREVAEKDRVTLGARFQFKGEDKTRFVEIHLFKAIPETEGIIEVLIFDNGEQSEIDEDLFLSESLYRAFLEQSPMGVIHLDETGLVIFENHRFRQLVGEAVEDAWIGRNVYDLHPFKGTLDETIRQMLRTGTEFQGKEAIFKSPFASERYFHVHGSAIRHPDGYFVGGVLLLEDVSAQKEQELQKERKKRYLSAETALRDAYFFHEAQTPFLEKVVEVIAQTAEADQAYILLRSDSEHQYSCHAAYPSENTLIDLFNASDYPILKRLSDERHLMHLMEGQVLSSDAHALLNKLNANEAIWCPFFENGRPFGFVALSRKDKKVPYWQEHDLQLTQDLVRSFESLWGRITAEVRYNQTVAAIDECLFNFEFTPSGSRTYTFMTRQVEKLVGYQEHDFLNGAQFDWVEHIVDPEDRALLAIHEKRLREGQGSEVTYRVMHQDGSQRWLRESASPHRDSAKRVTVGGILIDVTDQKSVETDLLNAKRAAESANQLKSAFLATMSHEIRTPLGAVNGFAELLSRELAEVEEKTKRPMPSQVTEFITAIRDNSQRLLSLVNDLFDLSNLETGVLSLRHISVPLHEVIIRATSKIAVQLSQKGLELKLNLAQNDPVVIGDPQRLQQVLENILENASKFTEQGSVSISTEKQDKHVLVEITDTGIGMSQEYVAHLFTPFMQEDRRLNRRFKGTGLGLALVKRVLELMNGKIEVKSEKGKGSTFRLFLPLAEAEWKDAPNP